MANVSALLDSNRDLSRRMMHLEDAFDVQTIHSGNEQSTIYTVPMSPSGDRRDLTAVSPQVETGTSPTSVEAVGITDPSLTTGTSRESGSPEAAVDSDVGSGLRSVFEFENDLETSRVYRRAQRETMDFSFRSSIRRTHAWSMLSDQSLANISVLSVIALPLNLQEIQNRHHYVTTSAQELAPVAEEESLVKHQEEENLVISDSSCKVPDLDERLKDLLCRVEDWKNMRVETFGRLVQFGEYSMKPGGRWAETKVAITRTPCH